MTNTGGRGVGSFFRQLRRVVVGAAALLLCALVLGMVINGGGVFVVIKIASLIFGLWLVGRTVETIIAEWRWEHDFKRRNRTPPTGGTQA